MDNLKNNKKLSKQGMVLMSVLAVVGLAGGTLFGKNIGEKKRVEMAQAIIDEEKQNHTWIDATCKTPKTCSVCGETEGDCADHSWQEATFDVPQTCSVCGETVGSPYTYELTTVEANGLYQDELLSLLNMDYGDIAEYGACTKLTSAGNTIFRYGDKDDSSSWTYALFDGNGNLISSFDTKVLCDTDNDIWNYSSIYAWNDSYIEVEPFFWDDGTFRLIAIYDDNHDLIALSDEYDEGICFDSMNYRYHEGALQFELENEALEATKYLMYTGTNKIEPGDESVFADEYIRENEELKDAYLSATEFTTDGFAVVLSDYESEYMLIDKDQQVLIPEMDVESTPNNFANNSFVYDNYGEHILNVKLAGGPDGNGPTTQEDAENNKKDLSDRDHIYIWHLDSSDENSTVEVYTCLICGEEIKIDASDVSTISDLTIARERTFDVNDISADATTNNACIVREEPTVYSSVVDKIASDKEIKIIGEAANSNWYKITYTADDGSETEGFVEKSKLETKIEAPVTTGGSASSSTSGSSGKSKTLGWGPGCYNATNSPIHVECSKYSCNINGPDKNKGNFDIGFLPDDEYYEWHKGNEEGLWILWVYTADMWPNYEGMPFWEGTPGLFGIVGF